MTEKIGAHLCQHCVGLAAVGHQARRLVERLVDVILEPKKKETQRAETKKKLAPVFLILLGLQLLELSLHKIGQNLAQNLDHLVKCCQVDNCLGSSSLQIY